MRYALIAIICLTLARWACADLPSGPLPDGLGVNIHFTDPRPGEMEMLSQAGFKWVRMDLSWGGMERVKGQYDFAAYDRLTAALEKHGLKAIFILDYGNPLYDGGLPPHTEEGRAAFSRWAATVAIRYAKHGYIWEMWNEPNGSFWKPKADADAYARLALDVGKALRTAVPDETYIGPATSGIDLKFVETCFKAGCLEYWSAVSVHPYRQSMPETAAADYRALRRLIFQYAPKGKAIPIIAGEWGYSAAWINFDQTKQGKYLAREFLTNQWQEVPLSIWYDWHDDGTDPNEGEHHFGTVHNAYHKDAMPVYEPKPAYVAMKTLADQLEGYRFNKRLAVDRPDDYVLLFDKGEDAKLVAWTTAKEPRDATLPASAGAFTAVTWEGKPAGSFAADAKGLTVRLSDAPLYLHPEKHNELLHCAVASGRLPLEKFVRWPEPAGYALGTMNFLDRPIELRVNGGAPVAVPAMRKDINGTGQADNAWMGTFEPSPPVGRSPAPVPVRVDLEFVGLGHVVQESQVIVTNPLTVTVLPRAGDALPVRVLDPDKSGLKANVSLTGIEGLEVEETSKPIELKPGESEVTVKFPAKADGPDFSVGVQLTDEKGNVIVEIPQANFAGIPDFASAVTDGKVTGYALFADGDKNVASDQSLSLGSPPESVPEPGMAALMLTYKADRGWKFWRVAPTTENLKVIKGEPKALGLWVWGDGSGSLARLRVVDSTGQTFQPAGERITWKGWRYVTIPMDAAAAGGGGHWGGADDGVIHYPIHWDTLVLLDRDKAKTADGTIYLAGPTLVR